MRGNIINKYAGDFYFVGLRCVLLLSISFCGLCGATDRRGTYLCFEEWNDVSFPFFDCGWELNSSNAKPKTDKHTDCCGLYRFTCLNVRVSSRHI